MVCARTKGDPRFTGKGKEANAVRFAIAKAMYNKLVLPTLFPEFNGYDFSVDDHPERGGRFIKIDAGFKNALRDRFTQQDQNINGAVQSNFETYFNGVGGGRLASIPSKYSSQPQPQPQQYIPPPQPQPYVPPPGQRTLDQFFKPGANRAQQNQDAFQRAFGAMTRPQVAPPQPAGPPPPPPGQPTIDRFFGRTIRPGQQVIVPPQYMGNN
jgi:hypothetical protein